MRSLSLFIAITTLTFSTQVRPETVVIEDEKAHASYEKLKNSSKILQQQKKKFFLITPDGKREKKPKKITLKVGESLFITNDEEKIVHNVYDQTDQSWVLKKQKPNGKAAIIFNKPGTHKLRCAIHPRMKVTVNVIE